MMFRDRCSVVRIFPLDGQSGSIARVGTFCPWPRETCVIKYKSFFVLAHAHTCV